MDELDRALERLKKAVRRRQGRSAQTDRDDRPWWQALFGNRL